MSKPQGQGLKVEEMPITTSTRKVSLLNRETLAEAKARRVLWREKVQQEKG